MKKQKIKVNSNYSLEWIYGVTIEQIRKDCDELEKLGVTTIEIEPEDSYGSCSVSFESYIERLETTEEYEKRIVAEAERKDAQRKRDLETLRQLKEKYES